ncbi:phosphate/phosphite/phosphonate ABC transporter substrate-binding protein [Kosakonia sp. BK9b]
MTKLAYPMYDLHRPDTVALLGALQELLAARGLAAEAIFPVDDLDSHWQQPDVLLSQTCGYPLATRLMAVQPLGCFHYLATGCEGHLYRSLLVARQADSGKALADFRHRRAVCNSPDSQSGYNVLRYMTAMLPGEGRFFSHLLFSGSHRQSLVALGQQQADIAAIDCVTYALLQRHQPALLAGLTVIAQSPLAPGLPLITAQGTNAETRALVQAALQQLVSDRRYREVCDAALVGDFCPVTRRDYDWLLHWRDAATARGVTRL